MRPLFILALAAGAWFVDAHVAFGHAALLSASPGPGAAVVGSPPEIVATFSQDLDMSRTSMDVRDAAGRIVASGPVRGDGPRELRLALPDLGAGEYEVRWTSYSAEDDELERGRYTFTVLPTPAGTAPPSRPVATSATAMPIPSPTPASTTGPDVASPDDATALVPVGVAAIALVALAAWVLRRR